MPNESVYHANLDTDKREALEALHDLYEIEIAKLGETEMALLADRLGALRRNAYRDIPARFDPAVKTYGLECQKWLGRLEKCKLPIIFHLLTTKMKNDILILYVESLGKGRA